MIIAIPLSKEEYLKYKKEGAFKDENSDYIHKLSKEQLFELSYTLENKAKYYGNLLEIKFIKEAK